MEGGLAVDVEKRLTNRATALRRWALTPAEQRKEMSQVMYAGLRAKFVRQAIEAGITGEAEIAASVERLYRAHMADMQRKSAAKRRGKK